jgi:hypothetical protein
MRVSVLQRNAYLTAVTGYPASSAAGEEVVTARLKADAEWRPGSPGLSDSSAHTDGQP